MKEISLTASFASKIIIKEIPVICETIAQCVFEYSPCLKNAIAVIAIEYAI